MKEIAAANVVELMAVMMAVSGGTVEWRVEIEVIVLAELLSK